MAARGLDGGAGRLLPADDRRPKVRRCLLAGNNPSVTESGSPSTTRALPLTPVRKADEVASKQQAMGAVRRCLRTRAAHLGKPRSRLRRLRA